MVTKVSASSILGRFWRAARLFMGVRPATPAYLLKTDVPPPAITPPHPPIRTAAQQARQERRRADYEKEFPYEQPRQQPPVEWVGNKGPEVPGGLPSLGKRRP